MQKKIIAMMVTFGLAVWFVPLVYAVPLPLKNEIRKEVREERMKLLGEDSATRPALKKRINTRAQISKAIVIGKGADSFMVQGTDGKEYKVLVDIATQWKRKFWGKSDIAETSVGDALNIHGVWTNEEMTEMKAKLIRNISIQKRHGVFFGTVKTLTSTGWVMTTAKRGDQTVTISSSTRLIDRKQSTIAQSSILAGHRVRIKGLWNTVGNTVTEVMEVKDFDLPVKPTASPKP